MVTSDAGPTAPADHDGAWEYPPSFVERMGAMLGEELPDFLRELGAPEIGLRVNTLRLSAESFESLKPFPMRQLSYPPEGFSVDPTIRAGRHPYHAAGLYYLQDPGAMVVGALVGAHPGERVLDLSAAPGGKSTHLAARMMNRGVLIANDVSRPRAVELGRNLERCGVTNAIVTCESPGRLAAHFGAYFDRVLVDAPCSGESMFHKSAAARTDWSVETVLGCARRQSELLRDAAPLVRPGGLLVYSTCTFSREENECVIEAFLKERDDFEPAMLEEVPGAEIVHVSGRGEGAGRAAYRLWPHKVPGAGHFVAVLRRVGEEGDADRHNPVRRRDRDITVASRDARMACEQFLDEVYPGFRAAIGQLVARGEVLYSLPEGAQEIGALDVVRPGLPLGTARRGRFEPSHALALAAPPTLARERVDLSITDSRVDRYLEGHPIEAPGPDGWIPIAVSGFALGWGKRIGGVVKNHYPKGLRRMG